MLEKKKLYFWRLAIIFISFTIIVLTLLWMSPKEKPAEMMQQSMGNMMKMDVKGSIYELFKYKESSSMKEVHSHHQNQDTVIYKLNFVTSSIVFLLTPFIIGGAITLAIVWLK